MFQSVRHLTRQIEKGEDDKAGEVRRQHQKMDRPGVHEVQEGGGEQEEIEKTGCEVICGAPTTPAVKRQAEVVIRQTLLSEG